jgi:hypothetical protein
MTRMSRSSYEESRLDTYQKLVASKRRAGDIEWLADRLSEVYWRNFQLLAAIDGLRERNRQLEAELLRCRQRRGSRS